MNGNFLKRVFASPAFSSDYNDFLQEFDPLMSEDNDKKIIYLSEVMEKCVRCNELKVLLPPLRRCRLLSGCPGPAKS